METPDGAKYELLVIIATIVVTFSLTLYTRKQREKVSKQKKERQQMARELHEIQKRLQ